ncbi:Heterogeneous nuclear ribonucleoprotein like [Heracleum sosnowskyi]|uniref:Heterogeneous nuclear ribonucleoprotein like n=1 Tax=Heracleum sosnowskyi TaxID=360622 RepID=A0AAD8JME4_9APIA|nr:Heterogeneous nuclear ribonucleoprotein like [Heracleum sosnowskyi]
MPPKKYCRNNVSYVSLIRRPARKSKVSDPQETLNPVQESPTSTIISPNLETPSQSNPNLTPSEEITAPVVESPQTLINESKIDGNAQDFSGTVFETPVDIKQETLVEKELGNDGGGDEKKVSESETKNVVKKKKTKIVKRIVKRKVLRKVVHEKVVVVKEVSGNDGTVSGNVGGEVKIVSDECVDMEVEKPNLKAGDSVDVEIGDRNSNVVVGSGNCESSDVGTFEDGFEANPTCIVWSEADNCSVVGEKQELEVFEVVKHCVGDENLKISTDAVMMQKGSRSCAEGKVDCSSTEDLSKVSGLDVDAINEKIGSVTGTQLDDCIVDHLRDQNHDSIVEDNLDSEGGDCKQEVGVENNQEFGSEDDKKEEGVNNKEECSDFGELKAETSLGDIILSGQMGALERRRRRKTEIFIGGLDKDTKEEDIRKIFEVLGEIKDVTLVNSSKTKNAFAFVRYTLAGDAKKALIKYRKVEICGRLCGASPVEGNDTLFLGKIDKRWKSDDVTKLLQGIGIEKIDHVTVISDPNNIELNRGFAFLELESNKDAQNAYKKLQKNGVFGKHLHIKVAWAEPLIEPDESELHKVKSVYAEYLPTSWDEQKVKDFFKRFGDIENVALARDMSSSRRKDFAFVKYTTRDAALACVEAFSPEQINDEGSKVKVKVSLAKPFPKGQQIKHLRTPPTKESKEKQKGTPLVNYLQESRITRNPTRSIYETRTVDQRSSMTSELLQLLRAQASMRPTNPSLSAGFVHREHPYPQPGRKRPFPVQGDGSQFSDPRGHPRARVEGSYPITNPSVPIRNVSMSSLPHHEQGASYISRPVYGREIHPTFIQPRERAPYHGNIGTYQRY